jgi:hypothetical protein
VPKLATETEKQALSTTQTENSVAANQSTAATQNQSSNGALPPDKQGKRIQSSAVMKVDSEGMPTSVTRLTPLPRINCATVIKGNTLYIYGGEIDVHLSLLPPYDMN